MRKIYARGLQYYFANEINRELAYAGSPSENDTVRFFVLSVQANGRII
jgi:hypothetical protein